MKFLTSPLALTLLLLPCFAYATLTPCSTNDLPPTCNIDEYFPLLCPSTGEEGGASHFTCAGGNSGAIPKVGDSCFTAVQCDDNIAECAVSPGYWKLQRYNSSKVWVCQSQDIN